MATRTKTETKTGKAAAPKKRKPAPPARPAQAAAEEDGDEAVAMTGPVEGATPAGEKQYPMPMRTPAHGRGKLQVGVPKGSKGGPGRPPNVIRAALREAFADRIPLLQKLADSPALEPKDRIRAIEMLAKYGLGTKDEIDMTAILKPLIVREVDEAPETPEAA